MLKLMVGITFALCGALTAACSGSDEGGAGGGSSGTTSSSSGDAGSSGGASSGGAADASETSPWPNGYHAVGQIVVTDTAGAYTASVDIELGRIAPFDGTGADYQATAATATRTSATTYADFPGRSTTLDPASSPMSAEEKPVVGFFAARGTSEAKVALVAAFGWTATATRTGPDPDDADVSQTLARVNGSCRMVPYTATEAGVVSFACESTLGPGTGRTETWTLTPTP